MKRLVITLSGVLTTAVCLFTAQSWAQEFVLEWQSPSNYVLAYEEELGGKEHYDFNGDGVIDILAYQLNEMYEESSINVFDGMTKNLLWSYSFTGFYDSRLGGFYDFNGDGAKEALFMGNYNDNHCYWIIDCKTNKIKFTLKARIPMVGEDKGKFFDIDNDGKDEIIAEVENDLYQYYIQIWGCETASKVNGNGNKPEAYKLAQNYPNPFNPTTTINYDIQQSGNVLIDIFDILGQKVRILVNEERTPGEYTIIWDGKDDTGKLLGAGNYFYQLHVNGFTSSKKMLMLK